MDLGRSRAILGGPNAEQSPVATRRFPHCSFGPFALRGLLRAKLLPGEVVVGWGSVERTVVGPARTMMIGLAMAPVFGPLLAAMLTHPKHRFLVVTDSRLIVLDSRRFDQPPRRRGRNAPSRLHVVAETPIGIVAVRPTAAKRVFRVALDDHDAPQSIEVPKQRGKAAERMLEALRVIANTDQDAA